MKSQTPVLKLTTTEWANACYHWVQGRAQWTTSPSCVTKMRMQRWENAPRSRAGKEERCGEQEYLESHREVHQVEVEVVQLQCSKALLASFLNQGLLMERVPQLWEETKPDWHFTAPTGHTRGQKLPTWWSGRTTPCPCWRWGCNISLLGRTNLHKASSHEGGVRIFTYEKRYSDINVTLWQVYLTQQNVLQLFFSA